MKKHENAIGWLPVDSRLFGPFLSFGHVRGLAKVFLVLELVLSSLVVFGTIIVVFIQEF